MPGILTNRIRRLALDERGTSLIEFAFAAPIFALLVVGVGDLARGFSEKYALQQAVNRTIELAHSGSNEDNYDYLKVEAATAAAAAGATAPVVTLDQWLECNGTKTKRAWTDTCNEGEQIARYITLTVNSSFRPSFGNVGYPGAKADGTVPIVATTSLRVQ